MQTSRLLFPFPPTDSSFFAQVGQWQNNEHHEGQRPKLDDRFADPPVAFYLCSAERTGSTLPPVFLFTQAQHTARGSLSRPTRKMHRNAPKMNFGLCCARSTRVQNWAPGRRGGSWNSSIKATQRFSSSTLETDCPPLTCCCSDIYTLGRLMRTSKWPEFTLLTKNVNFFFFLTRWTFLMVQDTWCEPSWFKKKKKKKMSRSTVLFLKMHLFNVIWGKVMQRTETCWFGKASASISPLATLCCRKATSSCFQFRK